jgi:hypothetical protein
MLVIPVLELQNLLIRFQNNPMPNTASSIPKTSSMPNADSPIYYELYTHQDYRY